MQLKQLRVGKVDGKHEYLTPVNDRERKAFEAFLLPEVVDPPRMNNGDVFFIEGFRGTGKTSLLRWHAEQQRNAGAVTDFVLFKSDLTEAQRLHISKEVGISWADVDSNSMEISQDFKSSWTWFLLHKIGEAIKANPTLIKNSANGASQKAVRLLGLEDESVFKKAIGFMPKLEGAHVKVKADVGFFEAELGGDFKRNGDTGLTTLDALGRKVAASMARLELTSPFFLYFDELEAFYHSPEQHKRDQRMVRDLLFSVAAMNDRFRSAKIPVHIIAAVRSEVIDGMGSLGQEVDRLVHDRGFQISWHHAKRSLHHPLIEIIKRKISASEEALGVEKSVDPVAAYFPAYINGRPIEAFLLDGSFYKPRDIVWRLTIAQNLFPNEPIFSAEVLHETETEYSSKLWDEVRYELSATYSDGEVDAIETALAGASASFELSQIETRFARAAEMSPTMEALLRRRTVREILEDLFRLGAIGNSFRVGASGSDVRKNRWSFRGDQNLLSDKKMEIHSALLKRLSAVRERRRGSRGHKS